MTDEKQPYNTPLSVQKIIKLFFRIRRGFFRTSSYHVNHGYFIASLQTSCVREAKWLAALIRMEFEKDMERYWLPYSPSLLAGRVCKVKTFCPC
jgi:hypothetical protein